jgi:hypothetical protein
VRSFERSQLTERLVKVLQGFEKNQEVTYQELSRLAKAEINARTPKLRSARFILERDHSQVWLAVAPGVGLRRADDAEIAGRLRSWWIAGARRKLDRGGQQSGAVELTALNKEEQTRFGVDNLQRELAFRALGLPSRRQLEKVATGSSNDMPSLTAAEWAISLMPKKGRPSASS